MNKPASTNKHQRNSAWRKVLSLFMASSRQTLLLGCFLSACTALMGSVLLGVSGWFITATYIAGLSAGTAILFDVFMPSAGIRLLAIGRTASRYAERLVTHDATFTVLVQLREKLFRGWSQPQALKQLQLRPSRILFRLTRDLDALQAMYLRILVPASAALFTALVAGLILLFFNIWLGIAVFVVMTTIGLGIGWLIARRSALASARAMFAVEQLRSRAVDLVAGQTDLVMAGQLTHQQQQVMAADARLRRADLAVNRAEVGGGWAFGMFQSCTLAVALLIASWLMSKGIVNAAGAAFVILLIWSVCEAFAAIRLGALDVGKTWVAARRLAPRLSTDTVAPTHPTTSAPSHMQEQTGIALQLHNVGFSYAGTSNTTAPHATILNTSVFKDFTLTIHQGEHVAIVGASGCGKSTLLSLVTGELTVQQGQLHSTAMSWLPQRTELFQDTVRGNLNLAHLPVSDEALWQVLQQAGLYDDIRQSSQGLDTPLGEGGMGLSGGQARRLALARLFLAQPQFWILDEPTEGLDSQTATDVLRRLKNNVDNKTVLIATHLRREAALADRLILLRDGKPMVDAQRGTAAFDQVMANLRDG
jgi:ATP-binding cassette subfamily C protein CydC